MEITIKYFGMIADVTSTSEEKLITELPNVGEIKLFIVDKYSALKNMNYTLVKNASICTAHDMIQDKDTIAFLPPFAGG